MSKKQILTEEEKEAQETRRRFEAKYRVNELGCFVWQAHTDKDGYGQFKYQGRTSAAHRVSYIINVGPIAPGYDVDHKCKPVPNRRCVNHEHLEVVTHAENLRRRRMTPTWAGQFDSEGNPVAPPPRPTSPDQVLAWVDELLSDYVRTERLKVQSVENAPWRNFEDTFEQALAQHEPMALVALYLLAVSMGLNWQTASISILQMNPLSLKAWDVNPDWKADFSVAKRKVLVQRWKDVEETYLDKMEREVDSMPTKEAVRILDVAQKREVGLKNVRRKNNEQPALPAGGNVFISISGVSAEKTTQLLKGIIEAESVRDVTKRVPALPPPASWPNPDDEPEDTDDDDS